MTDLFGFLKERQEWIDCRYELVRDRLTDWKESNDKELFQRELLSELALFLVDCIHVFDMNEMGIYETIPEEKKRELTELLEREGRELKERVRSLPEREGRERERKACLELLTAFCIPCKEYARTGMKFFFLLPLELFVQVWSSLEEARDENASGLNQEWKSALYYHGRDYSEWMVASVYQRILEALTFIDPNDALASWGEKRSYVLSMETTLWDLILVGKGFPALGLLFDKAWKERLLEVERNVLETCKEELKNCSVTLQWSDEELSFLYREGDMELSPKKQALYQEYLGEVHKMRQSILSSIDGEIRFEIN